MAQNSIHAGIFSNENGQRFLHILMVIAERGFGELYQNSKGDIHGKYYQRGLLHVQNWTDDMMEEDARVMSKKFPDLVESFEGCFMDYIMSKYRGQRPTVTPPSIFLFLRRFYESVAEHDALKTGDYFIKRDPIVQRITCMDACRQTFFALSSTAETVRVELASEAGSAAPYRRATTSTPTPSVLSQAKRRELEESVHPDDSASNVGGPAPAAARAAAAAELTPVKQGEEEVAPAAPSPPPSVAEKKAAPSDDDVRSHVSAAPSKRDTSSTVSRASPPPPKRGTSELSSTRPHQPSAKPPPPKPPASDVASRHDFVMSDEEDGELVQAPTDPIPQLERPRGSAASAVGSALDWERNSALMAPPRQRATVGVARAHSPQHHR